ncbi:type 2 isopentenyl-diphosphate Delta-isomerase [Methanothermobacter wolfeii]|uniref:Isopentenyl-diphosphate delta-isomerase n=1 Tax=Methanothermobacter wolfeii TaxID=145261 RepID=A0A9E7UM81_METWO|nr:MULTISPECIES: type 2 isopentenyl-diphosphate Delta-isomerase [Methanothermobacter]MDI6841958.1 type 2 isopentenyl-diphosphate Delta-isomerase [Methanothermobacter wolfeii]NLM03208.1 type 2 isopentenyl-diphosphate Delta-isomerase [Methanothermobacter wolfeii]QHN06027.1 type 2 isopentenyl-diphosphate Delta-isomerase [Methanothermobacter sp. THM-1]UXH32195.1 type 2 isopentenyl-diphosphate Delta-isomerase [Methanothermobacter wolfeii]SCM56413.1 Isopentenyl-diphosphate delta-isomerase {ECO:00002
MISDRKLEHLILCANCDVEYRKKTGFEEIEIVHRAVPEINKEKIDLSLDFLGKRLSSPVMIGAITGGHPASLKINRELARAARELGVALALGSQRAGVEHPELAGTYSIARSEAPEAMIIGNIGSSHTEYAERAVEMIDADALAVHLNPLQESIQPGGDINSEGALESIGGIVESVDVPVIVKETGAGICSEDAIELEKRGVSAIDVAGAGGTSWAAVETYRADDRYQGEIFWDWGIPTAASTVEVTQSVSIPVISSGGIRSGLDAAKAIALGAEMVGIALPLLEAASHGYRSVIRLIERFNESLRIAMYLAGAETLEDLKKSPIIIRGHTREWLHERGFETAKYARRS